MTGSPVIASVPVSGCVRTCRSTVCSPRGCGSRDSVGWGFAFLLLSNLCLCFLGLLSEITDPESFLKDLLNSVP